MRKGSSLLEVISKSLNRKRIESSSQDLSKQLPTTHESSVRERGALHDSQSKHHYHPRGHKGGIKCHRLDQRERH